MARTQRSIEERISEKEIQYEQVMEKAKQYHVQMKRLKQQQKAEERNGKYFTRAMEKCPDTTKW